MKKIAVYITRFLKSHALAAVLLVTIVGLSCWWTTSNNISRPLGNQLEYLGKQNHGSGLGDSIQYSVYYYGTDLGPQDIQAAFSAQYIRLDDRKPVLAKFKTASGDFVFTYETDNPLFKTTKKYIVSIFDSEYDLAKGHLK